MATLIRQIVSDGRKRVCNSRCYNAKRIKCGCICNGLNHSKGLKQATENTIKAAEELAKQGLEVKPINYILDI